MTDNPGNPSNVLPNIRNSTHGEFSSEGPADKTFSLLLLPSLVRGGRVNKDLFLFLFALEAIVDRRLHIKREERRRKTRESGVSRGEEEEKGVFYGSSSFCSEFTGKGGDPKKQERRVPFSVLYSLLPFSLRCAMGRVFPTASLWRSLSGMKFA